MVARPCPGLLPRPDLALLSFPVPLLPALPFLRDTNIRNGNAWIAIFQTAGWGSMRHGALDVAVQCLVSDEVQHEGSQVSLAAIRGAAALPSNTALPRPADLYL